MRIRIYYEDTDCGGIVYHGNYFKFCERARSDLFFAKNLLPQDSLGSFVVSSLEAKFILPARLGDIIEVSTEVIALKSASLVLEQKISRIFDAHASKDSDQKIFEMQVKLAYLNTEGRVAKIPSQKLRIIHHA